MASKEDGHNLPMYLMIGVLGTGGSHVATRMTSEEIDSHTIEDCRVFIDHSVMHCEDSCRITNLEKYKIIK